MQASHRTQRDWSVALAASLVIHLLLLGCVRFAPVPSVADADDATPIAILRITKRVTYAHGRRGGAAAAPPVSHAPANRSTPGVIIARGAVAAGSRRATTTVPSPQPAGAALAQRPAHAEAHVLSGSAEARARPAAETAGTATTAPGAEESPGPAPTITAEMLASLNQRMHDAIPSAAPQTMKHAKTDITTLAMRPDTNRWTAANYPLPQRGLFAHAIIVRVGREAIAVRAIQRVGNAYICIGYLAKIDEHNPDATLAGPYIGPCKKAWREQLGLVPKPSPSPEPTAGQSG